MAAQELRWLIYLLTDLGERPHASLVLYVDINAMIALCQEHRLEHRTKHIALRYFLARELQQRGQLRFTYEATWANTADLFTKVLQPSVHQRFGTVLDRRQRPVSNNQTSAAARAQTSPRPILPQPDAPGSASTRDEPSSSSDRPRPTLPRVVVPTFPERNRSQGQQKRNADADTPSPRHRMTKRQRNAITAKEKLHRLKLQDSQPDLSNRALAKLAKVQPCQIRDWKKMRERLEVASICRRRLMGAGRKSKYPFMERAVYRQFLKHRGRGLAVSVNMLQALRIVFLGEIVDVR
ncbi:unnamed protein product [Closterium sp. NIES-53]